MPDALPVSPAVGAASRNGAARASGPSRRQVLALAAVLTATVLTMAAAVAGLTRKATPAPASTPTVNQVIAEQPMTVPRVEPGD